MDKMNDREKEMIDFFKELSTDTQENVLSHVRFSVMAEKAVKKQYGFLPQNNLGQDLVESRSAVSV
jgi:hypothetical protein